MFEERLFAENQFVREKIIYEYSQNKIISDIIHIAYNINEAFFMQLGVSITSILENNKNKNIAIHVFVDEYKQKDLKKIKETAKKYKANIYIYLMDMRPFEEFHIKTKRFSRVTYLRLIMPKILKNITDKFLYMDADMICDGDISVFQNIDLQNKPLAAVSDAQDAVEYRTKFLKMKSGKYFNDGIMWINIRNWEKESVTERAFSYQGADPKRFLGQSQDILNMVLDGNIVFIDRKYNQTAGENITEDTLIYHFVGRCKPWNVVVFKRDRLWRYYLEISLWDNIVGEIPPKTCEHYYDYKYIAEVERERKNYIKMLQFYFWYAVLKISKFIQ